MIKKIILRTLALPFIFGLLTVLLVYDVCYRTIMFVVYGGEWITYNKKHNKKTVNDTYNLIKKSQEE